MRVLPLALGLLVLVSNLGCKAALFSRKKAQRGPCRAKNPWGSGYVPGTCMPTSQCIRPVKSGLARLKAPRFCGFKRLMPMVCCPDSAYGSGGPSSYGPYQPLPPYGSGGRAYPHWPNYYPPGPSPYVPRQSLPPHNGGGQGYANGPVYYPPGPSPYIPHQSMPPHGAGGWGYPNGPNYYAPGVGPQQGHGNSYGTGPVSPHRESSGGVPQGPAVTHGSVTPWKPTNPSGPQVPPIPDKTDKRPALDDESDYYVEESGDDAPCDDCEYEDYYRPRST
ncbi:uncharacterized protein LOC119170156 isoform X2 [Rhipicephalus microplus]|uniref:uncharacterized protein LOC119170156 isoform X2 n=1 Tax=Rhipicephalus microplus TaxID=6941 RepID=UPI003F6B8DC3